MLIDADGFGAPYPGPPDEPYPGGDGSYPVLPVDEAFQIMIGRWNPLVLGDVTAFRPPPPPTRDSAQRAAELYYWPTDPAGRPEPSSVEFFIGAQAAFYYALDVSLSAFEELSQKIHEYQLYLKQAGGRSPRSSWPSGRFDDGAVALLDSLS